MYKLFLTILTVSFATLSFAQIDSLSDPLLPFVPEGYSILDTVSGNLNLDRLPDMILILKKNGEDTTSDVINHPEKRPLLILLGQADKSYKLAARNDNAVLCVNCGGMMGDPFQRVVIKRDYFSVKHHGGSALSWTDVITFRYSTTGKYWYLYKHRSDSFRAPDPGLTTKILTSKEFGKMPFDKYDSYKYILKL